MISAKPKRRGRGTTPALRHYPFLELAADARPGSDSSILAMGAFLTLRLVDLFIPGQEDPDRQALTYQTRATRHFLEQLEGCPEEDEGGLLVDIVTACEQGLESGSPPDLVEPLLRYASHLERTGRLDMAQDHLETTLPFAVARGDAHLIIRSALAMGRVSRRLSDFQAAEEGYLLAEETARAAGDEHALMLTRIGFTNLLRQRGNLPVAEARFREIIEEARILKLTDLEAAGNHDLAVVLHLRGRQGEAAQHSYRALELYGKDRDRQIRVLHDLGLIYTELGHYAAAHDALVVALDLAGTQDVRWNSRIALLDLAARRGDRMGFEVTRRELEAEEASLPIAMRADLAYNLAQGCHAFGLVEQARKAAADAVALARESGHHQMVFRAEDLEKQVFKTRGAERMPEAKRETAPSDPALKTVAAALRRRREAIMTA